MYSIKAYRLSDDAASIFQMPVKRDWMEQTYDRHAYNCFPVTLTNSLGWGLSFPEDISFVWDGVSDTSPFHVKILSGEKYAFTTRSNATVSFNTNINFHTDKETSLLVMPASNFFINGAQCFTTLISSSFFSGQLPVVWRITEPYKVITIKANTPICTIIPIGLSKLQNSEILFEGPEMMDYPKIDGDRQAIEAKKIIDSGKWTNYYRDAVDWQGNKIGSHEVKSIKLFVKELGN